MSLYESRTCWKGPDGSWKPESGGHYERAQVKDLKEFIGWDSLKTLVDESLKTPYYSKPHPFLSPEYREAKRLKESFFGFKLHAKSDLDLGLIRAVEATPASVHDSRVDLSESSEVVYRDKGYFGVTSRGFDATMRRA